ncbi:MAG: hypothetical protein K6F14_06505 [Clostridiales bacterium]|nr:hypothetical protein [Clostridiales bacterium]
MRKNKTPKWIWIAAIVGLVTSIAGIFCALKLFSKSLKNVLTHSDEDFEDIDL